MPWRSQPEDVSPAPHFFLSAQSRGNSPPSKGVRGRKAGLIFVCISKEWPGDVGVEPAGWLPLPASVVCGSGAA